MEENEEHTISTDERDVIPNTHDVEATNEVTGGDEGTQAVDQSSDVIPREEASRQVTMATAANLGESEEEVEGTMAVGVREFEPDHQLTQAVQSSRKVTLKGEINMGGSINKTENKYEDRRVIHKTRQIVCGDVNNVTNTQSLNVQHHHGDVHHVTNIIQPEISTAEGQAKDLINSDADVFVETSLYRQALDKLAGPGCVLLVTGPTKCGKSCLGHALLRHFTEDGYNPLVLHSPKYIKLYLKENKKYAVLIDTDSPFTLTDRQKVCKLASADTNKHALIVVAVDESSCELQDQLNPDCHVLRFARDITYTDSEKEEMLQRRLEREKKESPNNLNDIVSTETSGYLFPLRCEQFAECVDNCSFDASKLFSSIEDIGECTGLEPAITIEVDKASVSSVSTPTVSKTDGFDHDQFCYNAIDIRHWFKDVTEEYSKADSCKPHHEGLIHAACRSGDCAQVEHLLAQDGQHANRRMINGITPLHLACMSGKAEIVEQLLAAGAKATEANDEGLTPLHFACQQGNLAVVKSIIEALNLSQETDHFHLSCEYGHTELVKFVRGCKMNGRSEPLATKLKLCTTCLANCRPALQNCRRHNNNVNQMTHNRRACFEHITPLMVACSHGHVDVARLLLENGACPDMHIIRPHNPTHRITPMIAACTPGHEHIVQLLLEYKTSLIVSNITTALHEASFCGHSHIVKMLLDKGADVNSKDIKGDTALQQAVKCVELYGGKNHFEVCKLLLQYALPESVNTQDSNGLYPLFYACDRKNLQLVELLLDHGAEVNKVSEGRGTPLHTACSKPNPSLAKLLIDKGADINAWCSGLTYKIRGLSAGGDVVPLYVACCWCNADVVQLLLEKGAKTDLVNKDGITPLHAVSTTDVPNGAMIHLDDKTYNDAQAIVNMLLRSGVDVNAVIPLAQYSALQMFCQYGHLGLVETLLNHGALPDIANDPLAYYSHSALAISFTLLSQRHLRHTHQKEMEDVEKIVQLLLKHGASLSTLQQGYGCAPVERLLPEIAQAFQYGLLILSDSLAEDILSSMLAKNLKTNENKTALHLACSFGSEKVVQTLLDSGADVSAVDSNRHTPLMDAIYSQSGKDSMINIYALLLGKGFDLLSKCLSNQDGPCQLQELVEKQVISATHTDASGRNILHHFVVCNYSSSSVQTMQERIQFWLARGADINASDTNGDTPLHIACARGNVLAAEVIASQNGVCIMRNNNGQSPLDLALKSGEMQFNKLQHLLTEKSSPPHREPLAATATSRQHATVKLPEHTNTNQQAEGLCGNSVTVEPCTDDRKPSFIRSSLENNGTQNGSEVGLGARLDPKQIYDEGETEEADTQESPAPEERSCSVQAVSQLVDSGDRIDSQACRQGLSSLHYACKEGDLYLAERLLSAGVDVNKTDVRGRTAVHFVSERGDVMMLDLLLHHGCDVRVKDEQGLSALHDACYHGHANAASILLSKGAEVKEVDRLGNTALHLACGQGHTEVAVTLLQGGARVMTQNNQGQTAMSLAASSGNELLVKVVERHIVEYGQGQGRLAEREKSQAERDRRLWKVIAILVPSVIMAFIAAGFYFVDYHS